MIAQQAPLMQVGDSAQASTAVPHGGAGAAPAWLNAANPFSLSQQASATLGGPIVGVTPDDSISPYQRSLSPYQVKGYRTLQNGDGSYLLLVDPTRQSARRADARGCLRTMIGEPA